MKLVSVDAPEPTVTVTVTLSPKELKLLRDAVGIINMHQLEREFGHKSDDTMKMFDRLDSIKREVTLALGKN